jgi:hypothetical protein
MRGHKTGGRQIGSPNKITTVFKDAIRFVYEDIGDNAPFIAWARENPTDFYKIAAQLIPTKTASKETPISQWKSLSLHDSKMLL